MSKKDPIFETISDAEIRDAVMQYIARVLDRENGFHSLKEEEIAYLTRLVFSETFLVTLKVIRMETKIDDFQFFNLEMMEGINQLPGEDKDSLGYKLMQWVHDELEAYRKED